MQQEVAADQFLVDAPANASASFLFGRARTAIRLVHGPNQIYRIWQSGSLTRVDFVIIR